MFFPGAGAGGGETGQGCPRLGPESDRDDQLPAPCGCGKTRSRWIPAKTSYSGSSIPHRLKALRTEGPTERPARYFYSIRRREKRIPEYARTSICPRSGGRPGPWRRTSPVLTSPSNDVPCSTGTCRTRSGKRCSRSLCATTAASSIPSRGTPTKCTRLTRSRRTRRNAHRDRRVWKEFVTTATVASGSPSRNSPPTPRASSNVLPISPGRIRMASAGTPRAPRHAGTASVPVPKARPRPSPHRTPRLNCCRVGAPCRARPALTRAAAAKGRMFGSPSHQHVLRRGGSDTSRYLATGGSTSREPAPTGSTTITTSVLKAEPSGAARGGSGIVPVSQALFVLVRIPFDLARRPRHSAAHE